MSNFDFLKGFNNELYEIGVKLEDDVLNSPRAVTADATLFLEALVTDIYLRSNIKMENDHISFYKKIDNIYRKGVISYIYKNKLREAYSLRNKIHKNCNDGEEEIKLAFDLHKRLYFIAKKYFRDFTDDERYVKIPDYKKPQIRDINFDNCIICGCENRNLPSNMCGECNRKLDNANLLLGILNSFKDSRFTKNDLIEYGLSESETNSFLIFLSKENIVMKKGGLYHINEEEFNKYLDEVNEYIEIGLLITQFYRDEISAGEIKATLEYWKGGIKQKPFAEFYRLVNIRLERSFEEALLKSENIKMSIKKSFMDELTIREWFNSKKKDFMEGDLDESFILFNELLIRDYFKLKKKNVGDEEIKNKLHLSDDIIDFWQNDFMSSEFLTKTTDIKKELIIKEIRKNKTLREALMSVGISQNEFNKIYYKSKNENDQFYKIFDKEYTQKRQKRFLRHLKINNLNKAIRISKITKDEFYKWYYSGEVEYSEFYVKTTKLLMNQYLKYRRRGWNKQEILKKMNISKEMVKSWTKHKDLDMVAEFEHENAKITSNFVKRGKIINALKDDKSKSEAIQSAQLTQEEFLNLYNTSKNEKSDFHIRFDEEYAANRKRLFPKLLVKHDFYNSIQKCEITQKQFNSWYFKDQDRFIETGEGTDFYIQTTQLLMIKYIKSRRMGKNKPDSARSVGLSNIIVDKWLRHPEFEMYWNFKKENDKLEKDLITEGFKDMKSKRDVSEYYDISPKTIDEFINLGKSGFIEFQEIFELYEDYVIPNLLKDFMNNLKNKPYNKALKASKITEEELEYYSRLGKSGNEKFSKFYNEYLKIKINIYVNTILSKKSKKIALKNSCLSKEEFRENEKDISQRILDGRFDIIAGEIERHKSTGTKLAKKAGITVNEIYDWYIKGKSGDEKFEDFASIFELGVILPRVMAVRHAKSVGVPKNWLHKKLKKELGSEEYKIWDKHGFIDDEEINHLNLGEIDEERIRKSLQNFEYIRTVCNEDDDAFQFMKKAVKSNAKYSKVPIHLSKQKEENLSKSEIVGK